MSVIIGLHQIKDAANLANVRRSLSCYGGGKILTSGNRINTALDVDRVPRPLRDHRYDNAPIRNCGSFDMEAWGGAGYTPVAIEVSGSQMLQNFQHPTDAFYIFGPEDGSIPPQILRKCHHVVSIPTYHCLNLAVAVSTVLYDRMVKL